MGGRDAERIEAQAGRLKKPLKRWEALALGCVVATGKVALWRALASIAETDTLLGGVDFNQPITRAELAAFEGGRTPPQ